MPGGIYMLPHHSSINCFYLHLPNYLNITNYLHYMSLVDLVMPKLGESIMEATILKWHKKPGDTVAQDETVLDIATDKVDSEVPSTAEGVIEEILFNENDVVPIGTVIAKIRVGAMALHKPLAAPHRQQNQNMKKQEW